MSNGNEKGTEKPATGDDKSKTTDDAKDGKDTKDAKNSAPAELPPHIKTKLRKLEKLESTYPGTGRKLLHLITSDTTLIRQWKSH